MHALVRIGLGSVIFEGCAESQAYASAALEPGPDGVFAIVGDQTWVRRGERELGKLEGGALIRSAPVR